MKKIVVISLAVFIAVASLAWGASIVVKTFGTDPAYTETFTLLSAATDTTNGSVYRFGKPFRNISCVVSKTTGTDPGSVRFNLQAGLDDTNLVTVATNSSSTWPALITTNTSTASDVMYVRGTISSWATETGTSILRMRCVASH